MKKTITRTVFATLALLFSLTFSSYAQTYYNLYLCDNTTVKLRPSEPNLANNDKVYWFRKAPGEATASAVGTAITYNGLGSADLTLPANMGAGLYEYFSAVETAGGCLGPQSDAFTIYKLPTKTLALSANRTTYCGDNSGPNSGSVVTATTTPAATLPAGIEYAYEWSVTLAGTPPTTATPGTADNSITTVSEYTMTTTTAGSYVFDATVKYVKSSANTGTFLSASNEGCEVAATATQTVTVTPRPAKPTISFSSN
ncbi:hypothetical protein D3C87_295630 [compost metagenome]